MWIIDRQRYWNFLKAYVICFVALVGLYVVIDAFSNMDEFSERTSNIRELMAIMGRFYLVRMSLFYDRLCGVIAMMAAIFTVTWMQRNNELIALLAAGISTRRVIRPVLVSAVVVSALAVVNQEWIMPPLGEELQKSHDDDGRRQVKPSSRIDVNQIVLHGATGLRESRTIGPFHATFPAELAGRLAELEADQARYVPDDDPRLALRGGWLIHDAQLSPADLKLDGRLADVLIELPPEEAKNYPGPVRMPRDEKGPKPPPRRATPPGKTYFLRTNVNFLSLTRRPDWYLYAGTPDLMRALADPTSRFERLSIAVFLHGRLMRPLLSLALMALSLPVVLGGDGRNMFVNLGLSLGISALFYSLTFMCSYLGNNEVMTPELAAWLPLFVFGTLAVARWDRIRT